MSNKSGWKVVRYGRVVASFGIGTAIRIYFVGILGGGWIDEKLGTSPLVMVLGILASIFMSFKHLLDQMAMLEKEVEEDEE